MSDDAAMGKYLAHAYAKDLEFVDGKLEPRTGKGWSHARLLADLMAWLWARREKWGVVGLPSYWFRTSETRVRMPNLCVVGKGDQERVRVTAPLLVIEILSPEDRPGRVMRRLDDFVAMGVENIWILDPADRSAATYSGGGMKALSGDRLEILGTSIYLDVAEMFAALDA